MDQKTLDAYAAAADIKVGDNLLAQISLTADEIVALQKEIAEDEAETKRKKEKLRQLMEDTLPGFMDAAGQKTVTTKNGHVVDLDESIYANISEERKDAAFAWLIANGHEALIKNEFVVAFPKNSKDAAEAFEDYLNKNLRRKANLKHKVTVHPSTLSSWVREELDAGQEIPLDLLGVTRRKVCKVK